MPLERITRTKSRSPLDFVALRDSPASPTQTVRDLACPACLKSLPPHRNDRVKHLRTHKRGTYPESLLLDLGAEMCGSCGKPYTSLARHHGHKPTCAPR